MDSRKIAWKLIVKVLMVLNLGEYGYFDLQHKKSACHAAESLEREDL